MQEKIDSGEINETFQIGAKAFTLEEWKDFLDNFDSIQEIIRELMRERHEKLEKEQIEKKMAAKEEMVTEILFSEHTGSTHFSADSKEEIRYITWYTEEGIFCRKAGQTEGYEWSIVFENQKYYEKVTSFIGQYSSDLNLLFAASEKFWQDFLKDKIDEGKFVSGKKDVAYVNNTDKF